MKPTPSEHRGFKDAIYQEVARVGQALSSAKRLELLDLLAQRERGVEDLARELGLSMANTSQHLQVLKQSRLVEVRRQGTYAFYRLADLEVYRLLSTLNSVARERLAEVAGVLARYVGTRELFEGVSATELLERVKAGKVALVDVRPAQEYQVRHLPGAISMPLDQLEDQLRNLPKNREVVVYCRGCYCVFADEAVRLLKSWGYKAQRIEEGPMDWKLLGLPLEGAVA
ncbi:MAG: metalloregulator ArsR/SmtB family transcription factor [Thermaceae bacterium]|nr:metalloregulator ArsR/SmtB family transcription factor [Thermaceae bacterium]